MKTRLAVLAATAVLVASESYTARAIELQDFSIEQCVLRDIINNQAPVIINIKDCSIKIVAPAKLGLAEVRLITPKLLDLRVIKYPKHFDTDDWLKESIVLSVEPVAYEHVREPAVRARILKEQATLTIGSLRMELRDFQVVNIGSDGTGWLGRTGDSKPFSIEAGDIESHTTMFKPAEPLSWGDLLKLIKSEDSIRVDLFAVTSGDPNSPEEKTIITTVCFPLLSRTHRRIAEHVKELNREPTRMHIYCDGG